MLKYLIEKPMEPQSYWANETRNSKILKFTVQKFAQSAIDLLHNDQLMEQKNLEEELNRCGINMGNPKELFTILFQTGHVTVKECKNNICQITYELSIKNVKN